MCACCRPTLQSSPADPINFTGERRVWAGVLEGRVAETADAKEGGVCAFHPSLTREWWLLRLVEPRGGGFAARNAGEVMLEADGALFCLDSVLRDWSARTQCFFYLI